MVHHVVHSSDIFEVQLLLVGSNVNVPMLAIALCL
jgi:hypothetical protein